MTNLELTDDQTEALIRGLRKLIDDDSYPLSPRLAVLKEILAAAKPEPERQRPVPPRHHEQGQMAHSPRVSVGELL